MEKIIITNGLNNPQNRIRKVVFYIPVVLGLIWFGLFFSTHYFTGFDDFGILDLVTAVFVGFFFFSVFFESSKYQVPKIVFDGDRIKANLPDDIGVENTSFDIAESDVVEIQHKVNSITLQLKNGESKEIHFSKFAYADVQKLKAYFDELDKKLKEA